MLQRRTFEPDTRWAANATLWPTPPIDWLIAEGFDVFIIGPALGLDVVTDGVWSQARSTAKEPKTTRFGLSVATCDENLSNV